RDLNPRPLGYEPSRHWSASGIISGARPAISGKVRYAWIILLWPAGSKELSTRTSLPTSSARLRVTRINPRALPVAARKPWMTGIGSRERSVPQYSAVRPDEPPHAGVELCGVAVEHVVGSPHDG